MPFTLKPAAGEDFFNREELLHEMLATLANSKVNMGYALIGPRRAGKTSILKEIALLSPTSPFYRQFIVRKVGPLDKSSVGGLLKKNLTRPISPDAIDEVYSLTYGIPFYVQFIGRELERSPQPSINRSSVIQAFGEMLQEEGDVIFAQEFYGLNDKERAILRTMAMGDLDKLSEIAHQLNETPNVISKYLEQLVYKGVIQKQTKGRYDITDPVFESWLKARFR